MPSGDTKKKFDSVAIYRIRKLLSDLSNKTGRGTELVSLYLPPKKAVHEAIAALREESGTASNIKSDTTRNHVQDALTKTMARLRLYKQTPENGIVIFCGAIPGPGGPGNESIELFEVLPQKPVSVYLYRCVAPETQILLDDRTLVPIRDLESSWNDKSVRSFESATKVISSSKIKHHLNATSSGRESFRLVVESGRNILATEDHPFFTPRGWVNLGDLAEGDLVAVNPIDDLVINQGDHSNEELSISKNELVIDEETLRRVDFPPPNFGLTVRRLKERGLLPLTIDNPKLLYLARLLGHLFSDGSLTRNVEIRNGKQYVHFTVDFCVGLEEDINELRRDLWKVGVKLPPHFISTHEMRFADRSYVSRTVHAKLRDTALITLLRALGAPVGSKVKLGTKLPSWILHAPAPVRREFLAAYMGGDGEAPRMLGSNPSSAIRLTFHRSNEVAEKAVDFARELQKLFGSFGVVVKEIAKRPSQYFRKDGLATSEIELRFQLTIQNVMRICHAVGYRYSGRKIRAASFVGEYLRIRSNLRSRSIGKMEALRQMLLSEVNLAEASRNVSMSAITARQWANGTVKSPIVRTTQVPAYEPWLELATKNLGENLVWENVISKELVQLANVMDLTVNSEDHNFFANGFLVHNCDDHFHLDPLRDMLREQNVIGILSMDATEAGLGIVSGDVWEVIDTMSSGVSGKTKKGGQCVSEDTLVQLEDGSLTEISKLNSGTRIASYDFQKFSPGMHDCADVFSLVPENYYLIKTFRPQTEIKATGEHRLFTIDLENNVITKQAKDLKPNDRILVPKFLPEPLSPTLATRFPARFKNTVDSEGLVLLKKLRIQKNLSQSELGGLLGLHQTEISQLERGERNLNEVKLKKIVEHLSPNSAEFFSLQVQTTRTLPEFFSNELLQLLGYIAGDGSLSKNRLALYEQRREVADLYSKISKRVLGLDYVPVKTVDKVGKYGSFAKHVYFETRIHSKDFADGLKQNYPELISTSLREIPQQIARLDNEHLRHFIRGLFDAEGFSRMRRTGISMKSGMLIRQLQMLLLRFGITSSYRSYGNRFGSIMHSLDIGDRESLQRFHSKIGFSAVDKQKTLSKSANRRKAQSYLNVPIIGSWVDLKAKAIGIRRRQFPGITNFFHDQRGISSAVYSTILDRFQKELVVAKTPGGKGERLELLEEMVHRLTLISDSGLILSYVGSVQLVHNTTKTKFFDIELPVTKSFVGNGIVLHNSARRYERLREMELSDYFRRLADHSKKAFLEQYQIKGLIVSGPGPTKDEFVKDGYLDYRLQNAVVGTIDSGYTGREGVRETIEKAGKLLENVRVVEEKKLVQRFLSEVNSDSGLAIYGIKDILASLKRSAVDTILVNEDVDLVYLKSVCKNCGNVTEKFVPRSQIVNEKQNMLTCPNCGSNEVEITERDVVDYLADASIESGAAVEVISSKTEDGAMLKNFGGVSAILRYRG